MGIIARAELAKRQMEGIYLAMNDYFNSSYFRLLMKITLTSIFLKLINNSRENSKEMKRRQGQQLLRFQREEALRTAEGITYEAGGFNE